jgi:hypothetical protein
MTSVESIAPNSFFGVETFALDKPKPGFVAHLICKTADGTNTRFRRLEVLDMIHIGGRHFVRCQSDILNPYPMLEALFIAGRSIISATAKHGYQVRFVNGPKGPVPNVTMHSTPKVGQRVSYRGPKYKLWERQFEESSIGT